MMPQQLTVKAINVWQNRDTITDWQNQITQLIREATQYADPKPGQCFNMPDWAGPWVSFLHQHPDEFPKAYATAHCHNPSFYEPLLTFLDHTKDDKSNINDALRAVPPLPELSTLLLDKYTPTDHLTAETWEHYLPLLDPIKTLRLLDIKMLRAVWEQLPTTPLWNKGAKQWVKAELNKVTPRFPRVGLVMLKYPDTRTLAQHAFSHLDHLDTAPEQLPDEVLAEWVGTQKISWLRTKNGWTNLVQLYQSREKNRNSFWVQRTIPGRYQPIVITSEKATTNNETVWRINHKSGASIHSTDYFKPLLHAGLKIHDLKNILPNSQFDTRAYTATPTHHPVAQMLTIYAPRIVGELSHLKNLANLANDTDDTSIRDTAAQILAIGMDLQAKRILLLPNDTQPITLKTTELAYYRDLLELTADWVAHTPPPELLAQIL